MTWKTYLIMYLGTDSNDSMTDIVKKIETLNFECTKGPVDFVFKWENEPTKKEICALGDKLKETLKNSGVIFNLDTHD